MYSIVVAVDENLAIGKENKIPWSCNEDMKFFCSLTDNHKIVMGRKTYESIGNPLKNRENIIISKTLSDIKGCKVVNDLNKFIEETKNYQNEIFIIGGREIYKYFLENRLIFRIYISYIHFKVDNPDCYFFDINKFGKWKIKKIYYGKTFKNVLYERDFS